MLEILVPLHFLVDSASRLACGLKITAKHYDLLKIYSENTLRTDEKPFCVFCVCSAAEKTGIRKSNG